MEIYCLHNPRAHLMGHQFSLEHAVLRVFIFILNFFVCRLFFFLHFCVCCCFYIFFALYSCVCMCFTIPLSLIERNSEVKFSESRLLFLLQVFVCFWFVQHIHLVYGWAFSFRMLFNDWNQHWNELNPFISACAGLLSHLLYVTFAKW